MDNIEDKKKEIVNLLYNDVIIWEYSGHTRCYTAEFERIVKGPTRITLTVRIDSDGDIYIGDDYIWRDIALLNKISEEVSRRQYQKQAETLDLYIGVLQGK